MNHDNGTSSWAEVATFVQTHPVPGMSLEDAHRIVTGLVRGPEAVLDLEDERGRWVVATIVDTCANVDHSADLALLGLREREWTPQALHHLLDRAEACVLQGPLSALGRPQVLVEGRKVQAFTTVRVHTREDSRTGEVRTLGREPGLRGTGLGEHALGRALELLRAERVDRFELEAAARNDAALRLYQRHGFQVVRSVPVFRRRLSLTPNP